MFWNNYYIACHCLTGYDGLHSDNSTALDRQNHDERFFIEYTFLVIIISVFTLLLLNDIHTHFSKKNKIMKKVKNSKKYQTELSYFYLSLMTSYLS